MPSTDTVVVVTHDQDAADAIRIDAEGGLNVDIDRPWDERGFWTLREARAFIEGIEFAGDSALHVVGVFKLETWEQRGEEVKRKYREVEQACRGADCEELRRLIDELASTHHNRGGSMSDEDRYYPFEQVRALISRSWDGNVLKPGRLMTDGRMLFRTKDVQKEADVQRLLVRPRTDNRRPCAQGAAADLFRGHVRASTVTVEIIGVYDGTSEGNCTGIVLLVDAEGGVHHVNAQKLAYFHRVIGFDAIFVCTNYKDSPLVLYRKGKSSRLSPVGLVMPLRVGRDTGKDAIQAAREQVAAARALKEAA